MLVYSNSNYQASFYNQDGSEVAFVRFTATEIVNPVCDSGAESPVDIGDGGKCDLCSLFECPNWNSYMGKIDQIIGAIPPPPNWNQVAGTFRDVIVPSLISEVGTLLGSAPSPPSPPPSLPDLDVSRITNNPPQMGTVPNLRESGFDKGKIEREAPEIEFRDDPTGGFNISNPIDSLPDYPNDGEFPKPGQTNPGEWGQNKPKELENEIPYPEEREVEVINPPIPGSNNNPPPTPGGTEESFPLPGNGNNAPPTPNGGGNEGTTNYKKHPDDPDGSG